MKSQPKIINFEEKYARLRQGNTSVESPDLDILIDNEILRVHRTILTTRNEVFQVMLDSQMKESKENRMEIKDCEPTAFKTFLVYLYTKILPPDNINLDLLMIADRYLDVPLKKLCFEKLGGEISMENILETAQVATQFNFVELMTACQRFFVKNYPKMTGTPQMHAILEIKPFLLGIVEKFEEQRREAKKTYKKLVTKTKTRKFILDGVDIYLEQEECEHCGELEDSCECDEWGRNRWGYGSGGFKPIAHSLRFFADGVEWAMKVERDFTDDRHIGINLEAPNNSVRADVRMTVLSNRPRYPNITIEKKSRTYQTHFFNPNLPQDEMEYDSAYVSNGKYFTLELFIDVLDGERKQDDSDDSEEDANNSNRDELSSEL